MSFYFSYFYEYIHNRFLCRLRTNNNKIQIISPLKKTRSKNISKPISVLVHRSLSLFFCPYSSDLFLSTSYRLSISLSYYSLTVWLFFGSFVFRFQPRISSTFPLTNLNFLFSFHSIMDRTRPRPATQQI